MALLHDVHEVREIDAVDVVDGVGPMEAPAGLECVAWGDFENLPLDRVVGGALQAGGVPPKRTMRAWAVQRPTEPDGAGRQSPTAPGGGARRRGPTEPDG